MASAREEILDRIRKALAAPDHYQPEAPDMISPIYTPHAEGDPVLEFADVFTSRSGQLFYVEQPVDFYPQAAAWVAQRGFQRIVCWEPALIEYLRAAGIAPITTDENLPACDVSFTFCEGLIARTGSILVSSAQEAGRRLTIYPPVHVVVGFVSQMLPDIKEGLEHVRRIHGARVPSMISMITGPSRTADIEKTLVMGAHGPKELILFLIDDLSSPLPPQGPPAFAYDPGQGGPAGG